MGTKVLSYEDLVSNKKQASIKTSDLRTFISDKTKEVIQTSKTSEIFLNECITQSVKYLKRVDARCKSLTVDSDLFGFINWDTDVFDRIRTEPVYLFCGIGEEDELYHIGVMLSEDEEDGECSTSIFIKREMNGFTEIHNMKDNVWELLYTPRDILLTEELKQEINDRTQTGRLIVDYVVERSMRSEVALSVEDITKMIDENKGLAAVLDEYSSALEVDLIDEKPILRPANPAIEGIAIGCEKDEYVLFQHMDRDAMTYMFSMAYGDEFWENNDLEADCYYREIDRTKKLDRVLAFIKDNMIDEKTVEDMSDGTSIDDTADLYIPISFNRVLMILYNKYAFSHIKYTLVQGGLSKKEKENLRLFKNQFVNELKAMENAEY